MKIAIFNPYKSQLVAAEGSMDYAYEQIKSVDGMAVEIKAFCNTDEIAKFAPNFIISHYNFTPKFCNIPTYITFNGPTSFKFRGPNDLRYCLAFDGYLTQSKQVAKSLEDLCFGFGKKFHALTNFANSCRKNEFFEVNLTNPKLIYFANNWEVKTGGFDGTKKPRFEELFKYLSTHTNFLELYGDAGGWSWIHNKKMIKGAIPFDDENSLNNVYRGGGVGLALSTHEYQKEGVGNNRIYEIVSSGSICIADDLPFYRETFGDNLFYVTTRDETEMGEQIIKHFEWIKNNPDEAKEKARNAHKIFCEKISMEEMVKNSISFHQEVERKNYLTAGYKADLSRSQKPMVSVVVRSGGRSKEMVARTLDSIAKQTYDNIQVVFILYKDNPELVELAETYKNKFADLIISKSSSPIRSTVMWEGISQTSGEYLAILDDDDIWYANHLSKIMEFFDDNEDAQFVYSGRVYYNENGTFPIKKIFHELGAATSDDLLFDLKYLTSTQNKYCLSGFGKTDYNELLRLNHPIHPCFVVKKSAITKKMLVDPEMHHAEDLYFCAMLYKSGCKFYWMPELTMQMNVHDSNSCTDFESEKLSWSARDRISLRLHHIASWSILSNSKNIASSKDEEFWKRGYVPKLYKIELLIRDSIHRIRNKYIRQKYLKNKAKKFTKKIRSYLLKQNS